MATSTITPRVVLQDDTGTFEAPNNDGTPINNALFQTLQDRIDALFSGVLTVGEIYVNTFGVHRAYVAGGSGSNALLIRNTAPGTGNYAALYLGNDTAELVSQLYVGASNTGVGSQTVLSAMGSGGLILASSGTVFGLSVQCSTLPVTITGPGATISVGNFGTYIGSIHTAALDGNVGLIGTSFRPQLTGQLGIGVQVAGGTYRGGTIYGLVLDAPVWTDQGYAASRVKGATLHIVGPPVAAGAECYSLEVASGPAVFRGPLLTASGTVGAPAIAFASSSWTGFYLEPLVGAFAGELRIVIGQAPTCGFQRLASGLTRITLGYPVNEAGAAHTESVQLRGDSVLMTAGAINLGTAPTIINMNASNFYVTLPVATGTNTLHWVGVLAPPWGEVFRQSSSARYKRNIDGLPDADALRALQLRPVLYENRTPASTALDGRRWPGLIAEEVHDILPGLVGYDHDGRPENVMYDRLPVYLLSALRQLAARVEALEGTPDA